MSIDSTLGDFVEGDESGDEGGEDDADVMAGARYGRGSEASHDGVEDAGECRNCGRDLANDPAIRDDLLRLLGDNHQRVPVCNKTECRTDFFTREARKSLDADLARTVNRARNQITK
jgi:hypothetical protein